MMHTLILRERSSSDASAALICQQCVQMRGDLWAKESVKALPSFPSPNLSSLLQHLSLERIKEGDHLQVCGDRRKEKSCH